MYLLDTNIVSLFDPRRRADAAAVLTWLRDNDRWLSLSVMTVTEIEAGILKLQRESKHARAAQLVAMRDGLVTTFADRILPMNIEIALAVARLAEAARPQVVDLADLIIAATADVHGLTVLTRNIRHFTPTGVTVIDPTIALPKAP